MKIKLLNTSQANFNKKLNDHLSFKQGNYESVEKTVDKILKKIEDNGDRAVSYTHLTLPTSQYV